MTMDMQPHGDDVFGWIVIAVGTVVTLWTILAAIRWVVRPGEADLHHPKRIILRDDR